MQIKTVTYDETTKMLTLVGSSTHDEAVAFLIGSQAMPAASVADVKELPAAKKAAAHGKANGKAKAVAAGDDDDDDVEDEEDDDDIDEDEEDEDEEPAKPAAKKGAKAAAPTKLKITAKMKSATKLREVVSELMEQGVAKKDLVAACVALKSKLPLLGRVENLDSRVPQAHDMVMATK
jgi:hypothetical protein